MEKDGIAARELKRRSREAFDGQAATYDGDTHGAHARTLYPHVAEEVVRAVAGMPAPHLLDLGCGTGALSELVLGQVTGASLTCLDLSPSMLKAARARLGGSAELVLGDAEKLPFRDGSFDTAWCNDSFHHYPDPERAAFQIWRVLKKGGSLVIGDVWQPAPARAVMNAWMPHSAEGDVRIYSEKGNKRNPRKVVRQCELATCGVHRMPRHRPQRTLIARASWDASFGADAYVQFLGALMPLMAGIACGLAADDERRAGRLANLLAAPSRRIAALAKLAVLWLAAALTLAAAVALFACILAIAGRLTLPASSLALSVGGLSQEELAVKLNVVRQAVSKWERGLSVPDADLLIALSEATETPVSELLGESAPAPKADGLEALGAKLEVVNLQLARQSEARRRVIRGVLAAACAAVVLIFACLAILSGSYLGWDLDDPETAVAVAALHAFEWAFVRLAPFVLAGAAVGLFLIRKRG